MEKVIKEIIIWVAENYLENGMYPDLHEAIEAVIDTHEKDVEYEINNLDKSKKIKKYYSDWFWDNRFSLNVLDIINKYEIDKIIKSKNIKPEDKSTAADLLDI